MKKRFAAILLSVCMLLTMIPLSVFAESTIVDSGECGANGNNVVWELDSNNTLTISGSGAMADYTWTNFVPTTPWYQYRNSIKRIVVKDGVTSIGSTAFYRLSYATSLEITNDVLAFGSYAFASCSNIQNVDFPDNLQYIANYCFEDCRSLTSVTIPETVTKLGDCVFTGCTNLESVDLPSNMTILPRGFFSECTSLESIEIPNSVTEFVSYCFRDCTGLKNITFPAGLTTIGYRVFSGCTGLEAVTLPDTVTTLGAETFYNCSGLVKLELPQSLQTVSSSLCYGCTKLQSIEIPASVTTIEDTAFSNCSSLSGVVLQEGLEKLGKSVFYKCTNLTNIVFPESITSIGTNAYGFYKNIYDETDVIPGAKLYCYAGSMGETYAQNAGVPYSIIDISIKTGNCEYTGNPVTPDVAITIDGQLLTNGADYVVEYDNNVNIGVATAKITFANDYAFINGFVKKNFRIGKLLSKCEITLDKEEYQYHMPTPEVTIKSGENVLKVGTDYEIYYSLSGETWKKPGEGYSRFLWDLGECSIRIIGINQYIGEEIIYVTITKFDMANAKLWTHWSSNGSSSFDMKDFQYDGTEKIQSGFRVCDPNDTIAASNYEITYRDNVNIGTATMIITGKGDYYTGTLEKQFEIYPRAIQSIEVSKLPDKLVYKKGETQVDVTGGEITIYYQDGGIETISMTADMLDGDYNLSMPGTQNIWLTYKESPTYFEITVIDITRGDVNNDGKITITDMLAIKSHILGKSTLEGDAATAADTNKDGKITITDFIQIKSHILGKSTIEQ